MTDKEGCMFGRLMSPQNSLVEDFWRLHQELDEMLGDGLSSSGAIRSSPRGSFPAINVIQTPAEMQVFVFAPGVDPKKLDVSIQQGLLTVSGERQIPVHERSEEHTSELQSPCNLVCRLLLEKKNEHDVGQYVHRGLIQDCYCAPRHTPYTT